jgi:hypothetical protein
LNFFFSRHGGDTTLLNDKKESVVDLASKQNCPELLQVIVKYHGQQMVHRQEKNFYDDHARTTKTVNGYHLSEH